MVQLLQNNLPAILIVGLVVLLLGFLIFRHRQRVRLTDNGEPGVADQFGIRLSNGYTVTTRLLGRGQQGGGNVQLHRPNPSTAGPNPAPDELMMCGGVAEP